MDILISGGHSSSNTVFIGRSAGRNTYNVDNSVFIGQNAGRGCYNTVRSIKISTSSTFGTRDFEWADTTDTDLLDIGGGIQGSIEPEGSYLHIGRKLDDFGTANGIDVSDLRDVSALTITPSDNDRMGIMLKLHPQDGNFGVSDQSQSLLRTEYREYGSGGTSQRNSTTNEIINKYGLLRLPKAVSSTGTGSATQLYDALGNEIARVDGVVTLYDLGSNIQGLAVCISNVWYKLNTITTF